MVTLPTGRRPFYAGIDPGFSGAIGLMNAQGTTVRVWDMPVTRKAKARQREIDLDGLHEVFKQLRRFPQTAVGLEWPTTRPGEGAERSERFGRGKGILEAFAYLKGLDYYKLAPNLWKGRLSLPGKSDPEANKIAARLFDQFYPDFSDLIRGPRGGIKDGRCDALLMAHFLRTQGLQGLQSVVERFGRDSDEAMALMLSYGRKSSRPVKFS